MSSFVYVISHLLHKLAPLRSSLSVDAHLFTCLLRLSYNKTEEAKGAFTEELLAPRSKVVPWWCTAKRESNVDDDFGRQHSSNYRLKDFLFCTIGIFLLLSRDKKKVQCLQNHCITTPLQMKLSGQNHGMLHCVPSHTFAHLSFFACSCRPSWPGP